MTEIDQKKAAMQQAKTLNEALPAISELVWISNGKSGDPPPEKTPTIPELASWYDNEVQDANKRLTPLLGDRKWHWEVINDNLVVTEEDQFVRSGDDVHDAWRFGINLQNVPLSVTARQADNSRNLIEFYGLNLVLRLLEMDKGQLRDIQDSSVVEAMAQQPQQLSKICRPFYEAAEKMITELVFDAIFKNGGSFAPDTPCIEELVPHPVLPLVEAWQKRPRLIEQDKRPAAICPEPLRKSTLSLPDLLDEAQAIPQQLGPINQVQIELPFAAAEVDSVVPKLPITRYDPEGVLLKNGGIVPYELRFLLESLISVGLVDRRGECEVRLVVSLREIKGWLWPNGWQRNRDLPKLRRGLIKLRDLRVYYDGWEWFLVDIDRLPTETSRLDDGFYVTVRNLPDSDRGPLLNREILRRYGAKSILKWRSYLRLAYLWDRVKAANGGHRIYATRPAVERNEDGVLLSHRHEPVINKDDRPVRRWDDTRAVPKRDLEGHHAMERHPQADRVPLLTPRDLTCLFYDHNPNLSLGARRERLRISRQNLDEMQKEGTVVVEKEGDNTRILEPFQRQQVGR